MNKLLAVIAAAALLAGVGTVSYRAGERHELTTGSTASIDAPTSVPADPTLDASCVAQPNLPPTCTQGSYEVSLDIGTPCVNRAYKQPEAWQWVGDLIHTARCMTVYP